MKAVKYGTLEAAAKETPSNKKSIVAIAAALAIMGLIAVSFSSGFVQLKSVIDSNYLRKDVAKCDADVTTMFEATCHDEETRFVLATFDPSLKTIVPAVKSAATTHWERDWEAFKHALPVRAPGVGFAVYNFPVWSAEGTNKFDLIPTFVSYLDADADPSARYLGGSYLGSAALAASCAGKSSLTITKDMSYVEACTLLTDDEARCKVVDEMICPFGDADMNPCVTEACAGNNNFASGELGTDCCAGITTYCANTLGDGSAPEGCSDYALAIYRQHCGGAYSLGDSQNLLLEGYADEEDQCLPVCANPCQLITAESSAADTYKQCSGCATDGNTYTYGEDTFAANCYPGQYRFQEQRCCGVRDNFAVCGEYLNQDSCDSMPELEAGCVWNTHMECSELLAQAAAEDQAAAEAAAAAAEAEAAAAAAAAEAEALAAEQAAAEAAAAAEAEEAPAE